MTCKTEAAKATRRNIKRNIRQAEFQIAYSEDAFEVANQAGECEETITLRREIDRALSWRSDLFAALDHHDQQWR